LLNGRKNNEISAGRILPVSVNPRDGWKAGLKGGLNSAMHQEMHSKEALVKTMMRDRDGKYLSTVADTPTGRLGDLMLPAEYNMFNVENINALDWSDNEGEGEDEDGNGDKNNNTNDDDNLSNGNDSVNDMDLMNDLGQGSSECLMANSATLSDMVTITEFDNPVPSLKEISQKTQTFGRPMLSSKLASLPETNPAIEALENVDAGKSQKPAAVMVPPLISSKSLKKPTKSTKSKKSQRGYGFGDEQDDYEDDLNSTTSSNKMVGFEDSDSVITSTTLDTGAHLQHGGSSNQLQDLLSVEDARMAYINETIDDDIIVDCRSIVNTLGKPNPRQLHNLRLRSAYEFYGSGGEPSFTTSRPSDFGACATDCVDYMLYSTSLWTLSSILLLPPLGELNGGQDIRETITISSSFLYRPLPFLSSVYDKHVKLLEDATPKQHGHGGHGNLPHDSSFNSNHGPRNSHSAGGGHGHRASSARSPQSSGRKSSAFRVGSAQRRNTSLPSAMHKQPFMINAPDFKNKLRDQLDQSILSSSLVKDKFWGGVYLADSIPNPIRKQFWLPNDTFGSSHFCLGVELVLRKDQVATNWST
jgi:hypothetical protein